ncbi:MAG TPA: hypothetical protein VF395_08930 [Polyangiaceae bacterium]
MKRKFVHTIVCIAVGSIAFACGGSSDNNAKTSPDAGTGKGSGGAGAGGQSSTSGGATSAGGSGTTGAGGGAITLPEGGLFGPPETIVLDTSCPDITALGTTAKGCCDKSGVCGSVITQINQCFTVADLAKLAGGALMFDAGPQKPCTYKAP